MKWFVKAIRNYAVISGRASREEYWMFILFYFIFSISAMALDYLLGTRWHDNGLLQTLLGLFLLVPSNTIIVRRLHDIGKSGKWYLWFVIINVLVFIAYFFFFIIGAISGGMTTSAAMSAGLIIFAHFVIAAIIILIPLCTRGTPGINKYGPNPEETYSEYPEPKEPM